MVDATILSPRSIEVTWDPSTSSGVTGYLISYDTTASYTIGGSEMVNGGNTTSGILTNLEEDTLYTIAVQATDGNVMSNNSSEVSLTTWTAGK